MSTTSDEKRKAGRHRLRVQVAYESVEDFLLDYTSNLSMGGMFIQTDRPLEIGARFRLRFQISGRATPVETYAEVKWLVSDGNLTRGMGVAFESLSESDERAVRRWLADWTAGTDPSAT
jgi:uncharacterized protein (TIGR02266 family)